MVAPEQVRWAGRRVEELAVSAGRAGIRVQRLLAGGALVGPAAVALYGRVDGRRREVGRAFSAASGRVEAVGEGLVPPVRVAPPALPSAGRPPASEPGVGAGSPDGLSDLMIELGRTARAWQEAGRELRAVLAGIGAGGGPGTRVQRLGADLREELPDLRRRRDLLAKEDGDPLSRAAWLAVSLTMMQAVKTTDRELYARLVEAGVDPSDLPHGGPAEAGDWWRHLTPRQRRLYTRAFPSLIGWTDGLPSAARDKANRLTLSLRLDELRSRGPEGLTPFELRDLDRLTRLMEKIDTVEKDLHQKIYLLGFSSTEEGAWDRHGEEFPFAEFIPRIITDLTKGPDGRVIISIGNPDSSRHVGIYIPGTTAQLDNINGDVERIVNLWKRGQNYTFKGGVSAIMWLGYDAPDGIVADAPRGFYADSGAPKLKRFVNGVRTAQGNSNRHVTVIGHSYGSVVVGDAAKLGNFMVDDIIVAGSPGMHVSMAGELGIGVGHVWAQSAEGDPVPDAGRLGHGRPNTEKGHWPTNRFPLVPSDPEFGAWILETDTHGHSDYWKEGTGSLDNQARVLTATYKNSTLADDPILRKGGNCQNGH